MNPCATTNHPRWRETLRVSVLCAVVIEGTVATGQAPERRVRVIQDKPGVPLEQRLLPTDDVVLVEREADTVAFVGKRTARGDITYAVYVSDVVAVVDVERSAGVLTPDRSWIETRTTVIARDVLKSGRRHVGQGQRLEIEDKGSGELTIGKVLVRASHPSLFAEKHSYLMFLRVWPDSDVFHVAATPYLIENGRLSNPLRLDTSKPDPIVGLTLVEAVKEVRRIVTARAR